MARFLFSPILFFAVAIQHTGCKKDSQAARKSEITFTYNGQTYTNIDTINNFGGHSNFMGFEFMSHVLGGKLHYSWGTMDCAYIEPYTLDIFNDNTCTFFAGGNPVDSSRIYTFVSGSKNYTAADCKTKTFLGQSMTVCTISGTFSVVVVNNSGNTKSITGTFRLTDLPPN